MNLPVAGQEALTAESPQVDKFQPSVSVRRNDAHIEIDQMAVVEGVALHEADAVRIVARGAGGIVVDHMQSVFEADILQQDGSVVTLVAQCIGRRRVGGVVFNDVLRLLKYGGNPIRAARTALTGSLLLWQSVQLMMLLVVSGGRRLGTSGLFPRPSTGWKDGLAHRKPGVYPADYAGGRRVGRWPHRGGRCHDI